MIHMLRDFYRSPEWETFRKMVIAERMTDEGFVIDEITGEPITKAYDIILHHIIPLTEENYRDVNIALNPDNIQIVSFKTHNKLHERFGFGKGGLVYNDKVYIVWGSPCAGKTTWVNSVASKNDLIVDMDKLYGAIKSAECAEWEKPSRLSGIVFKMRDQLIDMVKTRYGKWQDAYIIGGYPLATERERLASTLGAYLIHIDTSKEECLLRAKERPAAWVEYIESFWEKVC